jgi:hypothetical protein
VSELRKGAEKAQHIASEIRDLAAETEGPMPEQRTAANDLRRIAYELELRARRMSVRGVALGEPAP